MHISVGHSGHADAPEEPLSKREKKTIPHIQPISLSHQTDAVVSCMRPVGLTDNPGHTGRRELIVKVLSGFVHIATAPWDRQLEALCKRTSPLSGASHPRNGKSSRSVSPHDQSRSPSEPQFAGVGRAALESVQRRWAGLAPDKSNPVMMAEP